MLYEIYRTLRRFIRGRGLSGYSFLRNLDYRIKRLIRKPKTFIEVRGFKFFLDPKNSIDEHDFGDIEVKLIEDFLSPGDVFVDVGAHIGYYSVIASRTVGREGKVFAFEPNEKSRALLLRNLAENKCENVHVEHMAVSDKVGEDTIYTVGDLWFGSSLIDPSTDPNFWIKPNVSDFDDTTVHESKVKKTSLDAYLGNQRVDYVKTDTEGNDGLVFAGMKNIINNNPNIIIYMEFSPPLLKKFGTDPEKLVHDIKRLGFNVFMTDGIHVKPFETANFSGNLFCTRRDLRAKIAALK